ncbi:MAG TPA: ABC transporter ATP-binding protein [Anaerolineales bacterium]|nr:ABC transporter ATP-binding protein [Anaerolineales bacterium]
MIETNDLGKQFNDFWAVDGLTLTVKPGQILALLGQNGAGKTTTVRMLNSLLIPTRGWARVAGYDVARAGQKVRALVGVLTEQHGLYMRMTGDEYLEFFGQIYRLDASMRKARRAYLLDYFGLSNVSWHRIGEYSKGMRQKLALARALMHEPPVLLLDEPTSAMDPESARLVRDEIARLKSSQRAIVMCTHNLSEAETLADLIAIIYRGRSLMIGSLEDLKQKVLGTAEYEAQFSSGWTGDGLNLPSGVTLMERSPNSLRFRVEHPLEANPILMRELVAQRAPLMAFREVPRTLEQVYLKVMTEAQTLQAEAIHA